MEIIKLIRLALDLVSDADFLVVLGIAEKLHPGLNIKLDVDPILMEERFIEFFDSWALA